MLKEYSCGWCAVKFLSERKKKYCSKDCRFRANGQLKTVPYTLTKKPTRTLAEVNAEARALGLTYGQYFNRFGYGNDRYLKTRYRYLKARLSL